MGRRRDHARAHAAVSIPHVANTGPYTLKAVAQSDGHGRVLGNKTTSRTISVNEASVPCCTGSCFVAGTKVSLANGQELPIEKISVGTDVMAYDPDTGALTASPVTHTFVHPDSEGLVVVNGTLQATANHPFFANGHWVRADELQVGDTLLMLPEGASALASSGEVQSTPVQSLVYTPRRVATYNIEVANQHTYFAGGVLVHNKALCKMCPAD